MVKCLPNSRHRELVLRLGVQRSEDARNLTSLRARRRSPGELEQPPGNRRRKFFSIPFLAEHRTAETRKKILEV
jgi:hypothetical protein